MGIVLHSVVVSVSALIVPFVRPCEGRRSCLGAERRLIPCCAAFDAGSVLCGATCYEVTWRVVCRVVCCVEAWDLLGNCLLGKHYVAQRVPWDASSSPYMHQRQANCCQGVQEGQVEMPHRAIAMCNCWPDDIPCQQSTCAPLREHTQDNTRQSHSMAVQASMVIEIIPWCQQVPAQKVVILTLHMCRYKMANALHAASQCKLWC